MTDISGSILETAPAPFGEGLFLNYPHMGYYSGSDWNAYISASGGFLFKADDDNLISFGQTVSGGDGVDTKSFVLKSDNVYLSGSKINMLTDRFYLGSDSQFVSGSTGNIEISSSNFHLDRDGNVDMSGKITSTEGSIGGFAITSTAISSSNDNLILKSNGQITASAVSMSGAVNATSGLIGGMKIESSKIESAADAGDGSITTYTVTSTGGTGPYVIAGLGSKPELTFIPGNTYKFDLADDSNDNNPLRFATAADAAGSTEYTTGVTVSGTPGDVGAYVQIAVTQATPTPLYYYDTANNNAGNSITIDTTSPLILDGNTGQITGSRVLFDGGKIGGAVLTSGSLSSGTSGYDNDGFFLDSGGRFSLGDKLTWDGTNLSVEGSITISSGDLAGITAATISGSTTIPEGTLSGSAQIADQISGSSNEFSSSAASSIAQTLVDSGSIASSVRLTSDGLNIVRADNGTELASYGATTTIGSTSGEHISISSDALEIKTSSTNTVLSASSAGLEMQGTVKASGGEIGGFAITSTAISSSNDNLILKSSGQITASAANLSGKVTATSGQIASWNIIGDTLVSNNDDKIVLDAGNEKITINNTTFGNTGVQLESNDGAPKVFIGKSGGSFLKFNSQTDILQISSSTFELGSKGSAFVSASSTGTLEISSSNFHVATNGNVSMSGNIKAAGGQIATFTISSGSIDSDTSNTKRGLKLEPGDSIKGYGNTVHSTTTVPGKFSFAVGSIAPPAGAKVTWNADYASAPGGGGPTE